MWNSRDYEHTKRDDSIIKFFARCAVAVFIAVVFLKNFGPEVPPQAEPSSHIVTVDYRVRFEWTYTGTPDAYHESAGTVTLTVDPRNVFEISDRNNEVVGLPIQVWAPAATVIPIEKSDGVECKLHIGRVDGAVFCPDVKAADRRFYPMITKVVRVDQNHYKVLAAITNLVGLDEKADTTILDPM